MSNKQIKKEFREVQKKSLKHEIKELNEQLSEAKKKLRRLK